MKKIRFFTLLVLSAVLTVSAIAQKKSTKPLHYKKLQYPKLKEITIPEPMRYELPNGLIVYLLEDHTLPTIAASVMIHTGARFEPAEKIGLAGITGQVMRTGGTTAKTGDQLDELLERHAASVETFIGTTSGGARMSVLKEDAELGVSTLADILRNPAFRDDKIELSKIQFRSGISRRNDQVMQIASREFTKLMYGGASPYARTSEYETIDNITKQDLIDFHKKYYLPNNTMLAVWGDFEPGAMKGLVEKYFADWAKGAIAMPPVPQPRFVGVGTVNFIRKTDVNQSQIYVGEMGGKLNDPESPMLNLADQALGGGFASRLFVKVRTQQGLAYAIGSSWGEGYDYNGLFRMNGSTKSGTTIKMVNSIIEEFKNIVEKGITEDDLKYAKESYLNSYVFQFESKASVINKLMSLEFFSYPKDYYQKQLKEIQGATTKAVNEAIKKRWDPNKLAILVVGNDAEFDKEMKTLGSVRTIDITIPAPPEKFPDATAELVTKGKSVLQKTLTALGGQKFLDVKDLSQSIKMNISSQMGEMEATGEMIAVLPDKIFAKMSAAFGEMTMAWDGKSGWMNSPMGAQEMPAQQSESFQRQLTFNPVMVLKNLDSPAYTVWYYKEDKVQDRPTGIVLVKHNATNKTIKWFVDNESALLVKTASRERTPAGLGMQETIMDDYKDVGGVKFPFKLISMVDGKKSQEITLISMKINSGVKEDVFKKP
ncbi:MAG: insulinase family protein [Ignavibacteriales bacterium]|nr:insulinase family protein [Ignavibacteriales bacterium]